MNKKTIFDIGYTVFLFIIQLILLITFAFQYTSKNITNTKFFIVYGVLGIISLVLIMFSLIFQLIQRRKHEDNELEEAASTIYLSDTVKSRPLSHPIARISGIAITALIVVVTFLAIGALVPVPNPYSNEAISKSILEQHPIILNAYNTGVYPGFWEELPIFILINAITMGLTILISKAFHNDELRHNIAVIIICTFLALIIGAGTFTLAHAGSYGENNPQAYISAFIFEFSVQTMNQALGIFASFIPHALHNILFVLRTQIVFSIGGIAPIILINNFDIIISRLRSWNNRLKIDIKRWKKC